jgi:alpha-1,2-mannosyltransferase
MLAARRSGVIATYSVPHAFRLIALAVVSAFVVVFVALYFLAGQPFQNPYPGGDFAAYWNAAERLRDGRALYPPLGDPGAGEVYRYAPWFAVVWVPLTLLPRDVVLLIWQLVLLAAGGALIWPLLRPVTFAGLLVAALMVPLVIDLAWVGNVESLMVLAVAALIRRPIFGPVAVGLAASAKITPLAFVAYYVARRSWGRALLAIAVAAILWLPAIPLGVTNYPTAPLSTISLWGASFEAGFVVAVVCIAVTAWLALRKSSWTMLAAAVTTLAASPRLYLTNVPQLLVAVWGEHPEHRVAGTNSQGQ